MPASLSNVLHFSGKEAVDIDTVITVNVGSNSTWVYADEVLWIKSLKNITDHDTIGIVEDITTKFINGRSNRHFDIVTKNAVNILNSNQGIEQIVRNENAKKHNNWCFKDKKVRILFRVCP
jgi:hypothetical protein